MNAARSFRCLGCGEDQPARFERCPSCQMRGGCIAAVGPAECKHTSLRRPLSEAKRKSVERVRVPEPWHTALGGGLVARSSVMVWGPAKAGKTTETLRLACSLPGALYIPCEPGQDADFLRMVCDRDGLDLSRLDVSDGASDLPRGEQLGYVLAALREEPAPPLAVVDSLSVLGGEDEWKALREACRRSVFVCVMHVNKQGRIAGKNVIQHHVDTIVRVTKTALYVKDNRFAAGPEAVKVAR